MATVARDLRRGMVIDLEGHLWLVQATTVAGTAQRKRVVELRLRNLATGRVAERTLDEDAAVELHETGTRQYQYLYQDGDRHVFMDTETYDQIEVPGSLVEGRGWLLRDGAEFPIQLVDGNPVGVVFPEIVVDEVVETGEAVGSGSSNVWKEAKLASGITIKVPQFTKVGEKVRVLVERREYAGKEGGKKEKESQ